MPLNREINDSLRKQAEDRLRKSGEDLTEKNSAQLTRIVHDLQVYQIELEMQNDELQRTQAELQDSRAEYVDLFDFAPLGYLTITEKGLVHRANLASTTILGTDLARLLNTPLSMYLADQKSIPIFVSYLRKIFISHMRETCIVRMKNAKEGMVTVRLDSSPTVRLKDNVKFCTIAMSDITENMAEEELKSLLMEKETELKEVQHRVKNNFQTLYSLIGMQESRSKNLKLSEELSAVKSRLMSMSLVHDKLHSSGQFTRIDLTEYIRSLVNELYKNLITTNPADVKLELNLENGITTTVDFAIHLGMVINELITNSLKYAFPPGFEGPGVLSVSTRMGIGGMITLEMGDNGVGFPEGDRSDKTMGLKLANLLVNKQLNGTIERLSGKGTKYTIQIPDENNKKA